MKKYLHIFLFLPADIIIASLFIRLFYTCLNEITLGVTILLAIFIAFLITKKSVAEERGTLAAALAFVLCIISALAIFSSQNCARCSTPDASTRVTISNIRPHAELIYHQNSLSYETVCENETILDLAKAASESAVIIEKGNCLGPIAKFFIGDSDFVQQPEYSCTTSETAYEIKVYIPAYDTYWTVDSSGEVRFPKPGG